MKKFNIYEENSLKTNSDIYNGMLSAYSEEINAWYFYLICTNFLTGKEAKQVEKLFKTNGEDELEDHAYWLLERLNQLNKSVEPVCNLSFLEKIAEHKYINPKFDKDGNIDTMDILEKAKQSEIDAIETYNKLIKMTDKVDPVSNLKFKEILGDEEEHLANIEELITNIKNMK